MVNIRSQENQSKPNEKTDAQAKSVNGQAGKSGKSSHDTMSHAKTGSHEGAGGGKKQERHH